MKKIITSFFVISLLLAQPAWAMIRPNDSYYQYQWYLAKINADKAWDKISYSPDIVIAVIDSGVQVSHSDLKNNIWINKKEIPNNNIDDDHNGYIDDIYGWDFVNNVPDPSPKFSAGWTEGGLSHGTIIAGIIAAQGNNKQGVAGVTWNTQIMPLKVLNDKGEGRVREVVRAIDYAIDNGADIINLSFVSFKYSELLQQAIIRANKAGIIIVTAAGNEQSNGEGYDIDKTAIYPACYDGKLIGENMVIGVAATDALDQKTKFSSYGSHCVDISAPGISFFNTVAIGSVKGSPNQAYDGYWSGTSMATPLVTGAIALIEQANPSLSRREVLNILFSSTKNINSLNPGYEGKLGNGRLDVNKAVGMAKSALYKKISRILVRPGKDKPWQLMAANGDLVKTINLDEKYRTGNVITADVDNDGKEEFVIGSVKGEKPQVSILNQDGELLKSFSVYDDKFRGGVKVNVIDINQDGQDEFIVVPASGHNSEVRIYDYNGKLKHKFLAAPTYYQGGFSLAVGDIDGKGDQEIVLGFNKGNEPQVRIFNSQGKLLGVFLAYEKSFKGGVNVAIANIDGRKDHNKSEIIVSPGAGRWPLVKVFDNHAHLKHQFYAYTKNWQGGVYLSTGDIDYDGIADIAVGAYPGATPHVRVFSGRGVLKESFYALDTDFSGGVNIGIMKINN